MSTRHLLSPLLLAFLVVAQAVPAADQQDILARVQFDTKENWSQLLSMGLDIYSGGDDYFEIIISSVQLDALSEMGYLTEVVHESLSEFYRSRLPKGRDMGGYKTLDEINTYLDGIVADHPSIVSAKHHIGYTIEGRDMWAVKISDNPGVDEDEPEVLYTAAIHAREVITPEVLFHFMDHITDNYGIDPGVTQLVDSREIWLVVMVNPDGYYHNEVIASGGGGMWRKNRRDNGDGTFGVDLNRNFGYEWGFDDQGSSPYTGSITYRGTGPFSEPESENMRNFSEDHEFVIVAYFHSTSNVVIFPWGYNSALTVDNEIFMQMGDSITTWNGYEAGTGVIGYPANGVTDDWYYGEQTTKNKSLAMTFEVGDSYSDGFWPPPYRIPELVEENLEPLLFLTRVAPDVYLLKTPARPYLVLPSAADSAGYTVDWIHEDTLSPAVSYELVELHNGHIITDSCNSPDAWRNNGFTTSSLRRHSAPHSLYSGAVNSAIRYFQSKALWAVEEGDSLKFWTCYDLERDYDYAYVEVSTDGETFAPIPGNITSNIDPFGLNRGNGISRSSGGWVEGLFDLSAFVGQEILTRFSYYTDAGVIEEGFYVDDIYPHMVFDSETIISSTVTDTFYAFADEPPGIHYYMVRARDAQDQWGEFSHIDHVDVLGTQSCCIGDVGNVNGSEEEVPDIADMQALIDHLFINMDPVGCIEEADVDLSGQADPPADPGDVDISDMQLMIDALFIDMNPLPACP